MSVVANSLEDLKSLEEASLEEDSLLEVHQLTDVSLEANSLVDMVSEEPKLSAAANSFKEEFNKSVTKQSLLKESNTNKCQLKESNTKPCLLSNKAQSKSAK